MDAQTVAAAAGVQLGTLSTWIHRGIVPGVTVGSRGKAREFSLEQAIQIGVMTEMVRLRLPAHQASGFSKDLTHKRLLLVSSFMMPGGARVQLHTSPGVAEFDHESELPNLFADLGFRAPSYSIVDIELITENMKRAQNEWEARQKIKNTSQGPAPRPRGRPRKAAE
jgi:hypothetical protein